MYNKFTYRKQKQKGTQRQPIQPYQDQQVPPLLDLSIPHNFTYLQDQNNYATPQSQSIYIDQQQTQSTMSRHSKMSRAYRDFYGYSYRGKPNLNNISNQQTAIEEEDESHVDSSGVNDGDWIGGEDNAIGLSGYNTPRPKGPRGSKQFNRFNSQEGAGISNYKQTHSSAHIDQDQPQLTRITLQTYASILNYPQQTSIDALNMSRQTNTSRLSIPNKSNPFNKPPTQLLTHLLSHPNTLPLFLNHLTEQSISLKNNSYSLNDNGAKLGEQQSSPYRQLEHQQDNRHAMTRVESLDRVISRSQSQLQVRDMLACLLIKIGQASARCGYQLPVVTRNKIGDHLFNFGPPRGQNKSSTITLNKNSFFIQSNIVGSSFINNLNKAKSKEKSSQKQQKVFSQQENKKRIKILQDKLRQKDQLIQKIKNQYDLIIHNYAGTVQNLLRQKKDKNMQSIKNKNINQTQNNINSRQSQQNNPNQQQVQRIRKRSKQISEIQFQKLLSDQNKVKNGELLNRLSSDYKRKIRNLLNSPKVLDAPLKID